MLYNAFPSYVEIDTPHTKRVGKIKTFIYMSAVLLSGTGVFTWLLSFEYPTTVTVSNPSLEDYSLVSNFGPQCECLYKDPLPLGKVSQLSTTSLGEYTSFSRNGCYAAVLVYASCTHAGPCPYMTDPFYAQTAVQVMEDLSSVSSLCSMFISVEQVAVSRAIREGLPLASLMSEQAFNVIVRNTWRSALQNLPLFFGNFMYTTATLTSARIMREVNLLNTTNYGLNLANAYYDVATGLTTAGVGNFTPLFTRGVDTLDPPTPQPPGQTQIRQPGSTTLWPFYANPPIVPPPLFLIEVIGEGVDNYFSNLAHENILQYSGYVKKDYSELERGTVTSSYQQYFEACAPISCIYTTSSRMSLAVAFTTCMGVLGGLVTSIATMIDVLHKLFDKAARKRTSSSSGGSGSNSASGDSTSSDGNRESSESSSNNRGSSSSIQGNDDDEKKKKMKKETNRTIATNAVVPL